MTAEEIRNHRWTDEGDIWTEMAAQLAEIREELKTGNICLLNIAERFADFFQSEPVFRGRK